MCLWRILNVRVSHVLHEHDVIDFMNSNLWLSLLIESTHSVRGGASMTCHVILWSSVLLVLSSASKFAIH